VAPSPSLTSGCWRRIRTRWAATITSTGASGATLRVAYRSNGGTESATGRLSLDQKPSTEPTAVRRPGPVPIGPASFIAEGILPRDAAARLSGGREGERTRATYRGGCTGSVNGPATGITVARPARGSAIGVRRTGNLSTARYLDRAARRQAEVARPAREFDTCSLVGQHGCVNSTAMKLANPGYG